MARFLFLGWYVLFTAGQYTGAGGATLPSRFFPLFANRPVGDGPFPGYRPRPNEPVGTGAVPTLGMRTEPITARTYIEADGIQPVAPAEISQSWLAATRLLASSLPEATYRMWIEPIRPIGRRGDILLLEAPANVRTWVEKRYQGMILTALSKLGIEVSGIDFTPQEGPAITARVEGGVNLAPNPTHTFDRFVIGSGNRLAHSAALSVAEAPSEAYNPLFIHGPSGLGKTHLLGAIANYLEANMPALRVRLTTAEAFTEEFVMALRADGSARFKERYRNLDVLLIDDVQFLAGKQHTEEEFFHTFNYLFESGSQIVLSADRIPGEISGVAERLANRFEWGLAAPITNPDLPTRIAVLRRLVEEAGLLETHPDAIDLIASRIDSDLRQLRGTLTRVMAEASVEASEITREIVSRVLPSRAAEVVPPIDGERIREVSARYFGMTVEDLESRRRDRATVRARGIAMYLTREMTDLSLPDIGRLYGDRNHSTVLSSVDTAASAVLEDPELDRCITDIRAEITRMGRDDR